MVHYFTNMFYIKLYLKLSFLPWNIRFCWRRGDVEILKGRAVSFCRCADSAGRRSNTACRTSRNERLVQRHREIIKIIPVYYTFLSEKTLNILQFRNLKKQLTDLMFHVLLN